MVASLITRRLGESPVAEGLGTAPDEAPATEVENDTRCHIAAGERAWQMREDRRACAHRPLSRADKGLFVCPSAL